MQETLIKKTEKLSRTWEYASLVSKEQTEVSSPERRVRWSPSTCFSRQGLTRRKKCKGRIMLDISVVKMTLIKQNLWNDWQIEAAEKTFGSKCIEVRRIPVGLQF